MQKKWIIKTPNPRLQVELSNGLKIHPVIAQILINRRIETLAEADNFLKSGLDRLHDPFLLKDMEVAVERIKLAKQRKELVLIYGDYDVDGVTSSVFLKNMLKEFGVQAINYIPHRMSEGYGLNSLIVEYAKERKVGLLISVDCGISAFKEVDELNAVGIDVIIFDHHEPSEGPLPKALAVVDPKRPDCHYPFKGLAAVGLMAKLSQALNNGVLSEKYLDLIAIGTIADVAELKGENRVFVKLGLPRISQTKNEGLKALLEVAKIKGKKFRPSYVGFVLGPRLNASGRMGSALTSLELLLSEDPALALGLARDLEEHNLLRQKTQNEIIQEALNLVESEINFKDHQVIVLNKTGWHKGVLGIVASRIMEKYYRPAIVISIKDGVGTGSARSIDGFHIYEALCHCAEHLENYGGHKKAAGLTVKEENIEFFRTMINLFAKDRMDFETFIPSIDIDCEIPLSAISLNLAKLVDSLEPYGEGNPAPLFCSRGLLVKTPPMVLGKDTLKFWVTDGHVILPVIGFGMGKYREMVPQGNIIDLAYSISIDEWNSEPVVSLKLKDLKEVKKEAETLVKASAQNFA